MAEQFFTFFASEQFAHLLRAFILLVCGLLGASLAGKAGQQLIGRNFSRHHAVLCKRLLYWLVLALFVASALRELGFSLAVLLGAAGVLSVALGFAAQTSVSNLISGLFLIGERSFQLGDVIAVGDTTGEVLSIDLLSVKLRTFDNLYVRIPNESLIKSEVTTVTRFPIRRFDLKIGVAYKEDIAQVREVLQAVAEANPLCLDEPVPLFIFLGFGESTLDLQFSVWASRESYGDMCNSLQEQIKIACDDAGIELPFPHRTVYVSGDSGPLPVQAVDELPAAIDSPANR